MKIIATASLVVLLAGCGQQFRYPCQDPANWDKDECKRPICEVNRDCPDHIFEGNERMKAQLPPESKSAPVPKSNTTPVAPSSQGECK
jgi:hypothetical protein